MMLSAPSVADFDIRFLRESAHTLRYSVFTERDVISVCTAVLAVNTTTEASGVGNGVIYGKERKNDFNGRNAQMVQLCRG